MVPYAANVNVLPNASDSNQEAFKSIVDKAEWRECTELSLLMLYRDVLSNDD